MKNVITDRALELKNKFNLNKEQHQELLVALACSVIVGRWDSKLYDDAKAIWKVSQIKVN